MKFTPKAANRPLLGRRHHSESGKLQRGSEDQSPRTALLLIKHSGFFATPLETLQRHLGVDTLIVTGLATDICVYFTADDAYMRGYALCVPYDCVTAHTRERNETARQQLAVLLKADTRPSQKLRMRPAPRPQ
jgi:nicotinamidase-related amidase